MATRLKMDEKNEKAVRNLLKKTPNRRCINCNSLENENLRFDGNKDKDLQIGISEKNSASRPTMAIQKGPQYVCLDFCTFICTQCSGIHREFTHRVKSVSMSKFSSQEVANLENGGNERGREIYLKGWDSHRQPLPDSSNIDRLREFIKMVYVEKRFFGERASAEGRGGDYENDGRRSESRSNYRTDSRSPTYEERYDNRPTGTRRSNVGRDDRRPEYDERRSPARFETEQNRYGRNNNDHRRYEERPHNEYRDRKHYEDNYDRRVEEKFSSEKGNREYVSPPPIIPVKEILGDNIPHLRVEVHGNQTNGGQDVEKSRSGQNGGQRFGSSSSFSSVEGSVAAGPTSLTRESSRSLIDFLSEPTPPATTAATEMTDPFGLSTVSQPSATSSSSTGWASFDTFSATSVSPPQQSFSFTTSVSPSVPGISSSVNKPTADMNGNTPWATEWSAAPIAPALDLHANNWSPLMAASIPPAGSQIWDAFPPSLPPAMQTGVVPEPGASSSSGATHSTAAKAFATQELPEDLFSRPQTSLPFSVGPSYVSQYSSMAESTVMGMGSYSQPQKSRNPFDIPGDTPLGPSAEQFPSMTSMQAALPNFGIPSMPVTGPGVNGYGVLWNQTNAVVQPQTSYPPSVAGNFKAQQMASNFPQMMQQGVDPRALPNFLSMPNQSGVSPPYMSFQNQSSVSPPYTSFRNSSYGTSGPNIEGNPPQLPLHHSSLGMPGGSGANTDSFYPIASQQQRLVSQHSAGSFGSMFGTDPLFPSQPHSSHGSFSNKMGTDAHSLPQGSFHFNTENSNGNPFG